VKKFSYNTNKWGWHYTITDPEEKGFDIVFTVHAKRVSWLAFFLGEETHTFQIRGSGTVWHTYPRGNRIGISGIIGEYKLAEVYRSYQHFKEDNKAQ